MLISHFRNFRILGAFCPMEQLTQANRKVHLISLGCARNRVDSEVMLGTMMGSGWEATDEPAGADAIVINTCGLSPQPKKRASIPSSRRRNTNN